LQYYIWFETPPGHQGQVDFADFRTPWGKRHVLIVVLGYSRLMWHRRAGTRLSDGSADCAAGRSRHRRKVGGGGAGHRFGEGAGHGAGVRLRVVPIRHGFFIADYRFRTPFAGAGAEIQVPDRGRSAEYHMRLVQVAGADYTLQDLAKYAATILP